MRGRWGVKDADPCTDDDKEPVGKPRGDRGEVEGGIMLVELWYSKDDRRSEESGGLVTL